MATSFEKLQTLLSELFQLDQADLDFGIYRIMNQKRDEITRFLNKELLPQVKTAFAQYHPADKKLLEEKLEEARQAARTLGVDPEETSKVKDILAQIAAFSVDTEALENEVYSHLYSFFRRYYDEGDFISMRRYKEGVYAIPYEGEEVKLHWANADQYYIKTAEYFRDYTFKLSSGKLAHFKIAEADVEKDNVKAAEEKDRRFILAGENAVKVENDEIIIRFEYRVDAEKRKQDAINTQTIADVLIAPVTAEWVADLNGLAPSESNPRRTIFEKHLSDYTARNTFDYFIHKNLRGFLRRELDFYIKNEVMRLDDIENENAPRVEQYLSKVKALRSIAHKIIEFLAQIEDFQKKLWLKKKFVVETNYCMTLDRVPEELYPEIVSNTAQWKQWGDLGFLDDRKSDLFNQFEIGSIEYLKNNPYLMVDTALFDAKFKNILLASFDGLDDIVDGLLLNGDNFQALNILQEKYQGKINSIYIDPPYNTDASSIMYKNGYKDSSWLSLMQNRLVIARSLMSNDALICVAIDDQEVAPIRLVLSEVFYKEVGIAVVKSNPQSRKTSGKFSPVHEYALFYGKSELSLPYSIGFNEGKAARYPLVDETGRYSWMNFIRAGSNDLRSDRPKLFYPIVVTKDNKIRIPQMEWDAETQEYKILEKINSSEELIYPVKRIGENAIEKNWQRGHERVSQEYGEYRVRRDENGEINIDFKTRMDAEAMPVTWWDKGEYASANYGAAELKELFGVKNFDFPKAKMLVVDALRACGAGEKNSIVIDFFAGSGTTAHALISISRDTKEKHNYILIEQGQYFHTVIKPRIQKVVYSSEWKDGKPSSRNGSSHCFKYMRLESYEDVLNNLTFNRNETQQLALGQSPAFRENYMLTYMLDTESQQALINIESFSHPFDYKLNIATGAVGESKPTNIDLVETFNYLIGLQVKTMQTLRDFKVITGLTSAGERALIIWRDLTEKSNADLEEFFRKQDYNPRDMEFDLIYVNGDNNLENLRRTDETWKVRLIEDEFMRLMFDTK